MGVGEHTQGEAGEPIVFAEESFSQQGFERQYKDPHKEINLVPSTLYFQMIPSR